MKIDFMAGTAGCAPVSLNAGALDLAVGQSWRTRDGSVITIEDTSIDGRFICRYVPTENFSTSPYTVDACGNGKLNNRSRDLIERVTRVYIAGPMSGYPDLNFPAFHAAAAEYRKRGCFVINPAEINGGADEPAMCSTMSKAEYEGHWRKCMRADINALLSCEMIVMLDGWTKSKGARLEHHIAVELGMAVCHPT